MHRMLALLVLCVSLAIAADPVAEVDAATRAEVKALHSEAVKASDLWTILQLEGWADANNLRLRPALPGITVHGSPLLAAPVDLEQFVDLGTRVVAIAGLRAYHWRADGRPLACSRRLPIDPRWTAIGYGGSHLGLVATRGIDANSSQIIMVSTPLAEGKDTVRAELQGQAREHVGHVVIADDGSALALRSHAHDSLGAAVAPPRVILAHGGGQRELAGWDRPLAVGRKGAWLAARRPDDTWALVTAAGETRFSSLAAGPGIAVLVHEGACTLVRRDGTIAPLDPPIGLGGNAQVATVGDWLVFHSGDGGTTRPAIDLLGNPVGGGQPQAPTGAWLRWQDLLDDPGTPAIGREPMPQLVISPSHTASLTRWQERQLDLIDLSGATPAVHPFATATAAVQEVSWFDHCARVRLKDGTWQIFDCDGQELWAGAARDLALNNRGYAVAIDGEGEQQTYAAVRLDRDPAKRMRVPLALDPGAWNIRIDRDGVPAVAWREEAWRTFSSSTGAIIARGETSLSRPHIPWTGGEPHGAYARFAGRLLRKSAKATPLAPDATWSPIDAWRLGRTTAVIGRDGRVYITGKRGEFIDLGTCPGADRLVRRNGQLFVAARDGRVLAGFAAGPTLVREPPDKGEPAEDLPRGPWQIDGLEYVPPRAGNLRWNEESGLRPRRLRSPDAESMLCLLAPVVLELDAVAAKQLGRQLGR